MKTQKYDPDTDDAIRFKVSNEIRYYKDQITNSRWALETPEYEGLDEYRCRCDALQNYYEKRSDLEYKYGIKFDGDTE